MSAGCNYRTFPLEGANNAHPNPLAGFERPFKSGGKETEKGRKEGKEKKKRTEEMGKYTLPEINFWLRPWYCTWRRTNVQSTVTVYCEEDFLRVASSTVPRHTHVTASVRRLHTQTYTRNYIRGWVIDWMGEKFTRKHFAVRPFLPLIFTVGEKLGVSLFDPQLHFTDRRFETAQHIWNLKRNLFSSYANSVHFGT